MLVITISTLDKYRLSSEEVQQRHRFLGQFTARSKVLLVIINSFSP